MRLWIQAILAIGLGAAGVVAVAHQVPAARPALEQTGVMPWLDRFGLAPAPESTAAVGGAGGAPGGPRGPGGAATVIAAQPDRVPLVTQVSAIGTGTARRVVEVRPEIAGRLAEVLVSSGQRVSAGDVLARLDAESEEIAVSRAELVLTDAEAQFERLTRLVNSGSVSEIQLAGAELALRQAELAARQANFELERRTIRAPIGGLAGIVEWGEGDQIAASDMLTRIDDRAEILIDFSIPERFVSLLDSGTPVEVTPLARPDQRLTGRVAAIENRVDPATRSIRVRAAIGNEDDSLRSGMAFSIRLEFEGDTYPAIDPLAIQWSAEGSFVWVARDAQALRVPVTIMQRGAQQVLVQADFEPGDLVVTEGVQALRPGGEVAVQRAEQQG